MPTGLQLVLFHGAKTLTACGMKGLAIQVEEISGW